MSQIRAVPVMHETFDKLQTDSEADERIPWITILFLTIVFAFIEPHSPTWSIKQRGEIDSVMATAQQDEGIPGRRAGLVALVFYGLMGLAASRQQRMSLQWPLGGLLLCLLIWIGASFLWADSSNLSLRRVFRLTAILLAALATAKRFSLNDLLVLIVFSGMTYLVFGFACELALGAFTPGAAGYQFSGSLHPNRQGVNCSLLILASLTMAQRTDRHMAWRFLACAGIGFLFLLLTRHRMGVAVTAVALSVFGVLTVSKDKLLAFGLIAIAVACTTLFFINDPAKVLESVVLLGRESEGAVNSLNGRVPIWESCWEYVQQRPWTGFGYRSFWTPERIVEISETQEWLISSAHNGYLEMALDVGIIASLALIAIIVLAGWRSVSLYRATNDTGFVFLAAVVVSLASIMLLESTLEQPYLSTLIYLLVLLSLAFFEDPLRHERTTH